MKTIIIAFTLKGQDFEKIKHSLITIANRTTEPVLLIHGFMPRKAVIEKGFSTEVVDALEGLFPIHANFYWEGLPLREKMALYGRILSATVYVIGEIKDGVKEEVEIYQNHGLTVIHKPLL